MLLTNTRQTNTNNTLKRDEIQTDSLLAETVYCDHSHPAISQGMTQIVHNTTDTIDIIEKIFLFVRDTIVFGGDHWQVKASETLLKGYGACYNKNLLMVALLRAANIRAKLMANPVHKTFTKPSVGAVYAFFSDPFYHCFTNVWMDNQWIALDPTLDRETFETFFKPAGVAWQIDWDRANSMLLYSESIAGSPREYSDIDEALNNNLDSYFVFKHEPKFIRSFWLNMGNKKMWKKTKSLPRVA